MSGEGTDTYPEWDMQHGWIERTPNNTLMYFIDGANPIVLEIVDRLDRKIYPDPVGTDVAHQARIDKQVSEHRDDAAHYARGTSQPGTCECGSGVPAIVCACGAYKGDHYA